MNYFHYFTEIEDTFVRRRGKHLFLSSTDWVLMESWKELGVPLHVVLRAIDRAFDSFEAKPRKRSVKSLFYCQEEVEAQFAEWKDSQVGAGTGDGSSDDSTGEVDSSDDRLPFSRGIILEHLSRVSSALQGVEGGKEEFREVLARAARRLRELESDLASAAKPEAEVLEDSLISLEKLLERAMLDCIPPSEQDAARKAAEEQLSPYRSRMEDDTFEQTTRNLTLKTLRESHGIPRLSLFYIQ